MLRLVTHQVHIVDVAVMEDSRRAAFARSAIRTATAIRRPMQRLGTSLRDLGTERPNPSPETRTQPNRCGDRRNHDQIPNSLHHFHCFSL